jgi:hypothetical protein
MRAWIYGGMILTGESQRTLRSTCPSVTLSTTNLTRTDPGENAGVHSERLETKHLGQVQSLNTACYLWGPMKPLVYELGEQLTGHRSLDAAE